VNLARRIEAVCVAEGIETPQDLEECRRLGIPYGQGFYLAVPEEVPATRPARRVEPSETVPGQASSR
jgi:EAL domain-containing protein (putative c-di-GMP-specific phosphodiesterase class I)